jgi:hypothetical protein
MAQSASIAATKVIDLLRATGAGLGTVIANLSREAGGEIPMIRPESIVRQNAPMMVMEKAIAVKYPAVHVYSDRVQNLLTEKFRTFSGRVRTVAEVRVSQDRIEALEDHVRLYVDALTHILDANRGDWGQGMFFAGGYEVKIEPIQHGGKNFIQTAKVSFEVDLSS